MHRVACEKFYSLVVTVSTWEGKWVERFHLCKGLFFKWQKEKKKAGKESGDKEVINRKTTTEALTEKASFDLASFFGLVTFW